MKLPLSLDYIKNLFTSALESVARSLEVNFPLTYKASKSSKREDMIKSKKFDNVKTSKAKGSIHSDTKIYNRPRKDIPSIHEKH